jgi:hypothetical protein
MRDQKMQETRFGREQSDLANLDTFNQKYTGIISDARAATGDIAETTRALDTTNAINTALLKKDAKDTTYTNAAADIKAAEDAIMGRVSKDQGFSGLTGADVARLATVRSGSAADSNIGDMTIGEGDKARTYSAEERLRLGDIVEEGRSAAAPRLFGGSEALGSFMSSVKAGMGNVPLEDYKATVRLGVAQAFDKHGIRPTKEMVDQAEADVLKEYANAGVKTVAEHLALQKTKLESAKEGVDVARGSLNAIKGQSKDGQVLDPNGSVASEYKRLELAMSPRAFGAEYMGKLGISKNSTIGDSAQQDMNQRLEGLYKKLEDELKNNPESYDPRAAAATIENEIGRLNQTGTGLSFWNMQPFDGDKDDLTETPGVADSGYNNYVKYKEVIKSKKGTGGQYEAVKDSLSRLQKATQDYDEVKAAYGIVPKYNAAEVAQSYMRLPPVR